MARAHLGDEHLMERLQVLSDDPGQAHRRIEAGRRRQHRVLLAENRRQDELGGCLSVTAGDADFDEVVPRFELFTGVVEEVGVDPLLHGLHEVARRQRQVRNARKQKVGRHAQPRKHRRGRQRDGAGGGEEALHPRRIGQRLLGRGDVLRFVEPPRRRAKADEHDDGGDDPGRIAAHKQREDQRQQELRDHRDDADVERPPQEFVAVFAQPSVVAVQLVALQLQHVQVIAAGYGRNRRHQDGFQCFKPAQAFDSSKKFITIVLKSP